MKWPTWTIKYVQHELVKCGKPNCVKLHGPYWYGYNFDAALVHKCYIGKELPRELAHLTNDPHEWKEPIDGQGQGQGQGQEQDLPGQLVLSEMANDQWCLALGLNDLAEREPIRKRVYHYTHNPKNGQNDRTACMAWFSQLCAEKGWKLPR